MRDRDWDGESRVSMIAANGDAVFTRAGGKKKKIYIYMPRRER